MTATDIRSACCGEGQPLSAEHGFVHLTPSGWVRTDNEPFPADRVETWSLEKKRPAADAKERDRLTRIWLSPSLPAAEIERMRIRFGDPVLPAKDRAIEIQCAV
jgi:hypothetical protein